MNQKYKPEIKYRDWCITLGSWQDIFLCHVADKANISEFNILVGQLSQFCKMRGSKVGYICIVSDKANVPDSKARQALAKGMANQNILATAVIVERAKGFWGAAALGFISAVQSLSKQPYPLKNFSNTDDAAKWFSQITSELGSWDITPTQVLNMMELFKSGIEQKNN